MKRSLRIALAATVAALFVSAFTFGQEKKEQQKIKIYVKDETGTRVMIDTVFTGDAPDSVKLHNGNVFYIKKDKGSLAIFNDEGKNKKSYTVTVESDGDNKKEIRKDVTVISGDSSDDETTGTKGKSSVYYYVRSDREGKDENPEKFDIELSTGSPMQGELKSSRVIAKDGIVVTIEGNNEEKVKELAAFMESKLGVDKSEKKTDSKGDKSSKGKK